MVLQNPRIPVSYSAVRSYHFSTKFRETECAGRQPPLASAAHCLARKSYDAHCQCGSDLQIPQVLPFPPAVSDIWKGPHLKEAPCHRAPECAVRQ